MTSGPASGDFLAAHRARVEAAAQQTVDQPPAHAQTNQQIQALKAASSLSAGLGCLILISLPVGLTAILVMLGIGFPFPVAVGLTVGIPSLALWLIFGRR